ncbi:hypothetical protein P9112_005074 [Eukaryota sp. TZLM1-RC]
MDLFEEGTKILLDKCRTGIPTLFTGNVFVVFGSVISFLFSAVIGGNDIANAIGTTVCSGALSMKKAIFLACVFELSGAFFLGRSVTGTISSGISKSEYFTDPVQYQAGMFAALASGFIWLLAATLWSVPVSTTHSIVGAVMGFAIVTHGVGAVYWDSVATIAASWLLSPLLGAIIAYILFKLTAKLCFDCPNPIERTISLMPSFFAASVFVFSLFFTLKGLTNIIAITTTEAALISLVAAFGSYIVHHLFLRPRMNREIPTSILNKHRSLLSIDIQRPSMDDSNPNPNPNQDTSEDMVTIEMETKPAENDVTEQIDHASDLEENEGKVKVSEPETDDEEKKDNTEVDQPFDQKLQDQIIAKLRRKSADKLFAPLQILACAFIATAHGSVDIAKSVAPLAAILHIWENGDFGEPTVPLWTLFVGGVGLTVGLVTLGYKVIQTIGTGITKVTNLNGTVIQLSAAITVLLGSSFGLPISTSHILVGAVVGQAIARKTEVRWKTVRHILFCMVITLPIALGTSSIIMLGLNANI